MGLREFELGSVGQGNGCGGEVIDEIGCRDCGPSVVDLREVDFGAG